MKSQWECLRKKGFRKKSAELAKSDIRPTTCKTYGYRVQVNLDMTDSTGPGQSVCHMQNLSYIL